MTGSDEATYDVVVVGAGPAGLVLAALLDRSGVSAAVVDPNKVVCQHPRASHVDDEVMRILQTIGMDRAEPTYLRQTGFDFYAPDGTCFLKWDIEPGETDQGWQPAYQFFQPDFEAELRGRLATNEHTDLLIGWEATDVTETADDVGIAIRRRVDGAVRTVRARYVVGCDGSRSMVRPLVMKQLHDLNGTKQSVIIDLFHLSPARELPRTSLSIRCGPVPITHVPIVQPMSRFQFMLGPGEDPVQYEDPTTIYRLLDRFAAPDSYRIMRTDVYEWNAHLVEGWRAGRLMIAGDAAHLMPPMLGQGMCSGLRDVSNLAWKLARVVRGQSSAALLDTYESERSPHVRAMIAESARQANLVAAISRGEDQAGATASVDRSRKPLGPGLSNHRFTASGVLSGQPRDTAGARLDDLVGYAFTVVVSADLTVPEALEKSWTRMGARLVVADGAQLKEWLSAQDADAALVRPDRYLYAVTNGPDQLLDATNSLQAALAAEVLR